MMNNIFGLSAMGLVCALGRDKQTVWNNWLNGISPGMQQRDDLIPEELVTVGEVTAELPSCDPRWPDLASRNIQLLEAALAQIMPQIEQLKMQHDPSRIAIILGTSTSGVSDGEHAISQRVAQQFPTHFHYHQQEMGTAALYLQRKLATTGPAYCISTACSSSAKVFSSAKNLLKAGLADAAIVGGIDSLCKLTLNGFASLASVAQGACQPFGEKRNGINIGEGAALFIMQQHAAEVNLIGVGESADAHHMSAPHPEGLGAQAAMQAALSDAGIGAEQVDYINLHGTATRLNDAMEAKAVNRLFGEATACSSTKRQTGHSLGAAGAIENALCWLLLHPKFNPLQKVPLMIGDYRLDPELAEINLAHPSNQQYILPQQCCISLSNSFAFGGSNAAVCLARGEDHE